MNFIKRSIKFGKVYPQRRYGSLRDRLNSEQLAKDVEKANSDYQQQDFSKEFDFKQINEKNFPDEYEQHRRVEEVVEAMTEEEIKENTEIIKRTLIRGLRAAVIIGIGFAAFIFTYRMKRAEVEKKKQETPQEDVSQTLETFQQAFSDAVKESEDETETETEKEPTALSKIATSMKRFKFW